MQTKIVIPNDIYEKIKIAAEKNYRTINQEINFRLNNSFNSSFAAEPHEIAGIEFPAYPMPEIPSIITSTTQIQPQSYQHANTTTIISTPTSHTHADITPPGVQITPPDPHAGTINIKPGILPNPVKDYTQSQTQTQPKSEQNTKTIVPVSTDLEIEQVDNEWDAECNEYSTEDFLFDLKNLETKLREGLPDSLDPTLDPDYIVLKNYFIKHDLRERFRSLLSDPSRFYPEEGVYDNPQIKYARHAFRREKIDEDYIVALLSGTGAEYRARHKCSLYVDEQ